jgi:hypothetical protein
MMERRGVIRIRIYSHASIIARGGVLIWDCRVLDITSPGARLEFVDAPAIPIQFSLTFDSGKTLRDCDLIWRIANGFRLSQTNQ